MTAFADAALPADKSTIDRLRPRRLPAAARLALKLADRAAPELTARAVARLVLTPTRYRPRPVEAAALAAGLRIDLPGPSGPMAAWVWGEGPTALLAHGWSGGAGQMTTLAAALVARGLRVVALDLPGHGVSAGRIGSMPLMAEGLHAAAAAFGRLVGVVGHSLGAGAAILATAEGLPVGRIAAIAPLGRFDTQWARLAEGAEAPPRLAARAQAAAERLVGRDLAAIAPLRLAPAGRVPLLVVHDADDKEITLEEGAALAAAWPRARLIRTAGLGHVRVLRAPETAEAVAAFLAAPPA